MSVVVATRNTPGGRALITLYACTAAGMSLGCVLALWASLAQLNGTAYDGLIWSLYMLGTATVAGILGLVFGVPRARTEYSAVASERYSANSNLEQISDWLTKILVGAGLVELKNVPHALSVAGDYLGKGLTMPNASAFSASALVFGFGSGFGAAYLWTRLRLRLLLESSDRDAVDASRRAEQIVQRLQEAGPTDHGTPETPRELRRAVQSAVATASASSPDQRSAILWVDDFPSNNTSIVEALTSLGIRIDLALSTDEALRKLDEHSYGLVITDLGRRERGEQDDMAGLHLISALRQRGNNVPVIVFAGRRGLEHRQELVEAGALLVTNRASEVFQRAAELATSG